MTSIRAPTRSSSNSRAGCSSSCSGSSKYIEFRKPLLSRPDKDPFLVPGARVYLVLSVPYLVDRVKSESGCWGVSRSRSQSNSSVSSRPSWSFFSPYKERGFRHCLLRRASIYINQACALPNKLLNPPAKAPVPSAEAKALRAGAQPP